MPTKKEVISGRQESMLKELQGRWFEMGKNGENGTAREPVPHHTPAGGGT
jgi:hypothetical protein